VYRLILFEKGKNIGNKSLGIGFATIQAKIVYNVHPSTPYRWTKMKKAQAPMIEYLRVRIWYKDTLTDVYQVENSDLNSVRF